MKTTMTVPDGWAGFTLLELLLVMALMAMLLSALRAAWRPGEGARRDAVRCWEAEVALAREEAAAFGRPVLLAVLDPMHPSGDAPRPADNRCRIGLFLLENEEPDPGWRVIPLRRWQPLPPGVMFSGGSVRGWDNFLDAPPRLLVWHGKDRDHSARLPVLRVDPDGGIAWPAGEGPVGWCLAEGHAENGRLSLLRRRGAPSRELGAVGRLHARTWRVAE